MVAPAGYLLDTNIVLLSTRSARASTRIDEQFLQDALQLTSVSTDLAASQPGPRARGPWLHAPGG